MGNRAKKKDMMDLAIHIVHETGSMHPRKDPVDVALKVSRTMEMSSVETESFLMGISAARHFPADQGTLEDVRNTLFENPEYGFLEDIGKLVGSRTEALKLEYFKFIEAKPKKNVNRGGESKPNFSWAGALKELGKKVGSVDLQHKSSEMRSGGK